MMMELPEADEVIPGWIDSTPTTLTFRIVLAQIKLSPD